MEDTSVGVGGLAGQSPVLVHHGVTRRAGVRLHPFAFALLSRMWALDQVRRDELFSKYHW